METDIELVDRLCHDDEDAFTKIFTRYFNRMVTFVYKRIKDRAIANEIVQSIFLGLWLNRRRLEIYKSLSAYLFGCCKYKILTHERSMRVRRRHMQDYLLQEIGYFNPVHTHMNLLDIRVIEESTICKLPPKCQAAYRMSRQDGVPLLEIAKEMGISKRTVENYISQALGALRETLVLHEWLNDSF